MRLPPTRNLSCWQRRQGCTGLDSLGPRSRGPAAQEESQLLSSYGDGSHVEHVQPHGFVSSDALVLLLCPMRSCADSQFIGVFLAVYSLPPYRCSAGVCMLAYYLGLKRS
ncbi:hypothetical protein NDU88_009897 [Pleurodeles waltl]|uniref:Uncharacterized protein n=1 Tax=Pleurodeles waltl TaxID=8319 RepID=A0AAV7PTD1_PLEWA|nr:hypothetical protein NDU88_009897 [Pleurodeles waltl]